MSPGSSAAPSGKGTSQDRESDACVSFVSKNRYGEEEVLDAQEMLGGPLGIPTSGGEGTQTVLYRLRKE